MNIIREQQQWLDRAPGSRSSAGGLAAGRRGICSSPGSPTVSGAQPYSAQHAADAAHAGSPASFRSAIARAAGRLSAHPSDASHPATELLNGGVPIHVVQRYLGHSSPGDDDALRRHAAQDPRAGVPALQEARPDGRELELDPADIYEMVQLSCHTDRILPNGVCLLPPIKRCERGNACLTCDQFATDARHLPELQPSWARPRR